MGNYFAQSMMVCCCAGFFNPNGEGSKEYYETLGVEQNATEAQIKKAWKKKSLEFHPDKLAQRGLTETPEMRATLLKINRAYEVLSDREKRGIYDTLGERGVEFKEHPERVMNPEVIAKMLQEADSSARCNVLIAVLIVTAAVLMWPILFALRADGDIDCSWGIVWIPLWVFYSFGLMLSVTAVAQGPSVMPEGLDEEDQAEWEDPDPLWSRCLSLFLLAMFILWQALLCAQLDGNIDVPYMVVFIPFFISELYYIGRDLYEGTRKVEAPELSEIEDPNFKYAVLEKIWQEEQMKKQALGSAAWHFFRSLQVLIICLEVDDDIDLGWWLALLPLWLYVAMQFCCSQVALFTSLSAKANKSHKDQSEMDETERANMTPEERMLDNEIEFQRAQSSAYCCSFCCVLIFVVLLGVRLSGMDTFSVFWFFFPLFLCSCCIVFAACCCLLCVGPEEEEELDEDLENGLEASLVASEKASAAQMAKPGADDGAELAAPPSAAPEADLTATDALPSDTLATPAPVTPAKEPEAAAAPVATEDVELEVPAAAGADEDIGDID